MTNWNTDTILLLMVGFTGVAVLLQFCVLLGIFLTTRKALATAKEKADEIEASVMPLIHHSKDLVRSTKELVQKTTEVMARLEPKLDAAATDLSEMVSSARAETARIQASVDEINDRVRRQAARVDGMTTSVLNGVDRVGHFVSEAVNVPVRQVSGIPGPQAEKIVAAAKAVVDVLRAPAPPRHTPREPRATEDKDLFV